MQSYIFFILDIDEDELCYFKDNILNIFTEEICFDNNIYALSSIICFKKIILLLLFGNLRTLL